MIKKAYKIINNNKKIAISILITLLVINYILITNPQEKTIILLFGILLLIINTIFITKKQ